MYIVHLDIITCLTDVYWCELYMKTYDTVALASRIVGLIPTRGQYLLELQTIVSDLDAGLSAWNLCFFFRRWSDEKWREVRRYRTNLTLRCTGHSEISKVLSLCPINTLTSLLFQQEYSSVYTAWRLNNWQFCATTPDRLCKRIVLPLINIFYVKRQDISMLQ